MISFACISPHAPIFLPTIGSAEDRLQVKKTTDSLELLEKKLKQTGPDFIIISSPHQDWGFKVPLYFIANNFKGEVERYLTGMEPPEFYFKEGEKAYVAKVQDPRSKVALIASGDMSHCLKEDGPYGFHPDGPKFDKELIRCLKDKDIKHILQLEEDFPGAAECGLRSFCFMFGILEAAKIDWRAEILSYEGPFGVGYLVANFEIQ